MGHYLDIDQIRKELNEALALFRNEEVNIHRAEIALEDEVVEVVEARKIEDLKQKLS